MERFKYIIVIPGLGDNVGIMKYLTIHWKLSGFIPLVFYVGWEDREKFFRPKLKRLLAKIDELSRRGSVSLVGASAGGSAVINAFYLRKNLVHRVVSVCSMLKRKSNSGIEAFKKVTANSPAFSESVCLTETEIPDLSQQDRRKIMTIRARFGDELIPADTSRLPGAYNISIPTFEHKFSIGLALTVYSKSILRFLD